MHRKKILFCDNSLKMFLNFRMEVLKAFSSNGHHIYLIVPTKTIDNSLISFLPSEIELIGIDYEPDSTKPIKDLKLLKELLRIYKKVKPDIAFHYTIKPNIYGTLAAKRQGIRSVAMVAGLGYAFSDNSLKKKLARRIYKYGLRRSDRVLVLNQSNYNTLLRGDYVREPKLLLLTNGEGVDLNKFNPGEIKGFPSVRFLMIGRVLYDKGYKEFVEAAKIVKKKFANVSFELYGPLTGNSLMAVGEEMLTKDCEEGNIKYYGESNRINEVLKEPGVVAVTPSFYPEGLNRTLMEACATGVPIITTDIPGCRELVDDGVNGFLVSPKDSESLAEAMIRFIELPEVKKIEMGKNGRAKAEKQFDVKNVIEEYERILEELAVL